VKSSRAEIQAKFHKIPVIRFEDQKLTSFSGLLIFQVLFSQLRLKERLKKCFEHLKISPIFGRHLVVLLLIVHLVIGFRRLREIDYYAAGSDQATRLLIKDFLPKSGCFQALDRHFHTPKCPCKQLGVPGVDSFRYHQSPHALSPCTQAFPSSS
jgi:hypothetical protein